MNKNNQPTVLLIARVSDIEQRKALPAQEKRLKEYAKKKHWIEGRDFKYIEFDETAFKGDIRKEFERLVVQPVKESTEKLILAFDKTDRFSRDTSDEHKSFLVKQTRLGNIELHFVHDGLFVDKTSPATDWFRLDINVALASYYSASIRDNVNRRFGELRSKGVWLHRAPVGYKNIHIENPLNVKRPIKDIVVDESRSHLIVKAFELRAKEMPYSLIAKELLSMGYTSSKTGKAHLNKSIVEKIISGPNSKFYYGVMTCDGVEYKHKYKPLIDRALYNQCQIVKEKRKGSKTKWDSLDFTFSDIVSCGKCGRTVSPFNSRNLVYLHCANPVCKSTTTAESLVIDSVKDVLSRITVPEDMIRNVILDLKSKHDDQQLYYVRSIEATRKEYDDITKKLDEWFDRLLNDRITPERHDQIVDHLTNRQLELNDQLDILTNGNKDFLVTSSYLLDLASRARELFDEATEDQRSKLLGFLLSNIELRDKKLSFNVNYPFDKIIEVKEKDPEGSKISQWCWLGDVFLTFDSSKLDTYKLRSMADMFNLDDSLLRG